MLPATWNRARCISGTGGPCDEDHISTQGQQLSLTFFTDNSDRHLGRPDGTVHCAGFECLVLWGACLPHTQHLAEEEPDSDGHGGLGTPLLLIQGVQGNFHSTAGKMGAQRISATRLVCEAETGAQPQDCPFPGPGPSPGSEQERPLRGGGRWGGPEPVQERTGAQRKTWERPAMLLRTIR